MKSILFVCTGNIFRSMIAEYALKKALGQHSPYQVASAGTQANPQAIVPLVLQCLQQYDIDPTQHQQRRIVPELFVESELLVAMGCDHQEFISAHFGEQPPLFNEICHRRSEPVRDTNEAVPDFADNPSARDRHIGFVVDHICQSMPAFIENVPSFLT